MKNILKNFKWVFCKDFILFCYLKFLIMINLEYFLLIEMLRLYWRENVVNYVYVFYCGNLFVVLMEKFMLMIVLLNVSMFFFNLYVFELIIIFFLKKNFLKIDKYNFLFIFFLLF